jgi:hypothetical protein
MTRHDILQQYTDEIMELIKLQVATRETVFSALNAALSLYAIVLTQQQDKTLRDAFKIED